MINPLNQITLSKDAYERVFHKLAQGHLDNSVDFYMSCYVQYVTKRLEELGCIVDNKLDIKAFKEALEEKRFDVNILNKALWSEAEDINF